LSSVFEFREELSKAGIKIYPETYVSLMFFLALLTVPVTVASIVLLYFIRWVPLIFLVPAPVYVMIGFMIWPSMNAGGRKGELDR